MKREIIDKLSEMFVLLLFTLGVILMFICIVLTFVSVNQKAIASEKAMNICISRGYDSYESFSRQFLGDKPYGVKCNHVTNKKEYDFGQMAGVPGIVIGD